MASHHQHNLKKFLTVSLESKKLIPAENAPLPQLDRGTDYESVRRGFESLTAHHLNAKPPSLSVAFLFLKVQILPNVTTASQWHRGHEAFETRNHLLNG